MQNMVKFFRKIISSSKVGHANINAAELLSWNLTVAHSQARTFRFLNKNQLFIMFLFPWVYLDNSPNNERLCPLHFC